MDGKCPVPSRPDRPWLQVLQALGESLVMELLPVTTLPTVGRQPTWDSALSQVP